MSTNIGLRYGLLYRRLVFILVVWNVPYQHTSEWIKCSDFFDCTIRNKQRNIRKLFGTHRKCWAHTLITSCDKKRATYTLFEAEPKEATSTVCHATHKKRKHGSFSVKQKISLSCMFSSYVIGPSFHTLTFTIRTWIHMQYIQLKVCAYRYLPSPK